MPTHKNDYGNFKSIKHFAFKSVMKYNNSHGLMVHFSKD